MSTRQSKKVKEITERNINFQTGEIVTEMNHSVGSFETEPDFIKLYLKDILYLKDLPKGLNTILYQLIRLMNYDNEIVINSGIKRKIASTTGLAFNTINGAISDFVKGKILIRADKGIYKVNPYLFGKGRWEDIKRIRATIEYTLDGRTIHAEIIRDSEILSKESI